MMSNHPADVWKKSREIEAGWFKISMGYKNSPQPEIFWVGIRPLRQFSFPVMSAAGANHSPPHGGIMNLQLQRFVYQTPRSADLAFNQMVSRWNQIVVVPRSDKAAQMVRPYFLLGCGKHVVVPLSDIDRSLRTLYLLRYG